MSSYPFNPPLEPDPQGSSSQSVGSGWMQAPDERFTPSLGAPTPSTDIYVDAGEIWVYVDVPGFTEDDVHVSGDETTLIVSADRIENPEDSQQVVLQERARELHRVIPLPAPVEISEAIATYEQGVCKVTLPKSAAQRYEDIPFRHE